MRLDIFNNLIDNVKENNFIQNFIKELSNHLDKTKDEPIKNNIEANILKQENCIYQVVEMNTDGVYLQNTSNNKVSKETDISREVLDRIGEDSVLIYKNDEYVIDEELTQKFFDSLIEISEYKKIQDNFMAESNILKIDSDTRYKIESREEDYYILTYGENGKNTIKVPKALISFWAKDGEILYYKDGKFNRDI